MGPRPEASIGSVTVSVRYDIWYLCGLLQLWAAVETCQRRKLCRSEHTTVSVPVWVQQAWGTSCCFNRQKSSSSRHCR